MSRLRAANPGTAVEVWAEDEARLGLKPITRRVWWLRGCRPRSCGRTKYEWLYVYGFARPATGQTFTALLPRVNVERMAGALAAFAAHADPGGKKVLVVVVDNAGWHTAKRLPVPAIPQCLGDVPPRPALPVQLPSSEPPPFQSVHLEAKREDSYRHFTPLMTWSSSSRTSSRTRS